MCASSDQHEEHHPHSSVLRLAVCAVGICVCYMSYGMVQERLFGRQQIGPSFVLLIQCIVNTFVAKLWEHLDQYFDSDTLGSHQKHKGSDTRQQLNHPLLALTSFCYVSAMVCTNESLHYVSYPTAVLAKSCKLIPTMAMGVLVEKKMYKWVEWLAALCITSGIVIFNLSRLYQKNGHEEKEDSSLRGLALLTTSLLMDGFLNSFQGLLKQNKPIFYKFISGGDGLIALRAPNAVETMLYVNAYALVYLIPLTIINKQMQEGLAMLHIGTSSSSGVMEHEHDTAILIQGLIMLNMAAAIGQIFIFLTITWYSSLVCTTITTTRKFFTILLSIVYFGHHFTSAQWFSTVLVFTGLYLGILGQNVNTAPLPSDEPTADQSLRQSTSKKTQ